MQRQCSAAVRRQYSQRQWQYSQRQWQYSRTEAVRECRSPGRKCTSSTAAGQQQDRIAGMGASAGPAVHGAAAGLLPGIGGLAAQGMAGHPGSAALPCLLALAFLLLEPCFSPCPSLPFPCRSAAQRARLAARDCLQQGPQR